MRRTHSLTKSEQRELGIFLGILVAGCLCLAAALNLNFSSLPLLAATSAFEEPQAPPTTTPLPVDTPPTEPVTLILPPPPPLPYSPTPAAPAPDIKYYKGETYRYVRTMRLKVTAYAPDPRCCYPYPGTTTSTGHSVKTNGGKLVAADPRFIPMHSLVVVPGYSNEAAVPVLDTGGKIKGHRLDVLLPTFQTAKNWGVKTLDVKIYEPVK